MASVLYKTNDSSSVTVSLSGRSELDRQERMAAVIRRWQTEAQEFTENTTAHGIGRAGNGGRPIWYRLIWLAIVLAAMSVAMFNCEERIREYLSHPFQIIETFEPQADIPFPSVTICNAFPLPVLGRASELARSTIDRVKVSQCYNDSKQREHVADLTGSSEQTLLFSAVDGNLTDLGFTAESMIPRCRFNNKKCSIQNFIRYIDPDFFNCYTFNTQEMASNNKILKLLIYMSTSGKPYNYTDVLEFFTHGAYIQVHEPGVHPTPMKVGRAILPGTHNLLSLQTYRTELLKHPVATNCTSKNWKVSQYRYNVDVCYKICMQAMLIEKCGCASASIHIEKPSDYGGPFCFHNYCNMTLIREQTQCISQFYADLNFNISCRDCKMPQCVSWEYKDHHSMVDHFINFPAHDFVDDFLEPSHPAIADMLATYGNITNVPDNFISKNFAQVTVTFSDLHIRRRTAQITMSGFSLFSDLGGAFGFWIGFSIMTFVELIEWIVRMLISVGRGKVGTKQDTK